MTLDGKKQAQDSWTQRRERYKRTDSGDQDHSQLESIASRVRPLVENDRLRDWAFAPFRAIFHTEGDVTASQVRKTITGVALANAVMAGLPGKLGVGVGVSMALEAFMALRIAQHVGLTDLKKPQDTLTYFGALGGTAVVILWAFRQFLGVAFSLFNLVGALPATFLAELTVTNFVGVLFWVGFTEIQKGNRFNIPSRTGTFVLRESGNLVKHQWRVLKGSLSPGNIATVGKRVRLWITGDMVIRPARIRDEVFVAAAMAALVDQQPGALDGPMSALFLQSIRDLYPDLASADLAMVADHFQGYDEQQMVGVLNQVKGRLHERMVEAAENVDGDEWLSRLHDDPYHRSTDIIFENTDTGELFEVSLKATDNPAYIEHALSRYGDDPVMVTEEVASQFEDDERVTGSGVLNEDLEEITADNFDEMLEGTEPGGVDVASGVLWGTGLGAAAMLWPYVVAWKRGRISKNQLETASTRILGASGAKLVPRLTASLVFGPVYMWYALARGVMSLSEAAQSDE